MTANDQTFVSNSLVPELSVVNLQRSLHFYCDILGFTIEFQRAEEGFAYLSFHGSQLMLDEDGPEGSPWMVAPMEYPRGRGMNLSIKCPDVQALASRLEAHNIPLQKPVEENWYRNGELYNVERNFLVLDPEGYLLRFQQSLGHRQKN